MNFENIYHRVSPVDCVCNAHLLADWYIGIFWPQTKNNGCLIEQCLLVTGKVERYRAVVSTGETFGVTFWQLPVFHTHGPSSLAFMLLGHLALVVHFVSSCWFVLLETARWGRLCLHEWGISVSTLFTAWLATHQTRLLTCATPLPTATPREAPFLEEDGGGASPSVSPAAPPCESNQGGAELVLSRHAVGADIACSRQAIPRQC